MLALTSAPSGPAAMDTVGDIGTSNAASEETAAEETIASDGVDGAQAVIADASAVPTATDQASIDDATASESGPEESAQAELAATAASGQETESAAALAVVGNERRRDGSVFANLFSRQQQQSEPTRPQITSEPDDPEQAVGRTSELTDNEPADEPKSVVTASITSSQPKTRLSVSSTDGPVLPGVREVRSIYEIPTRAGFDYNSYDDENGTVQLASAVGLAALAGSRLAVQREDVDVSCLKPRLVQTLRMIEAHFGRKLVVTSGYRNRQHNRRVGGARESKHMFCEAADIQVPGISKWQVAEYVRALPGRGGVGTYCHTESIHVDIGSKRDWNWRCRRGR